MTSARYQILEQLKEALEKIDGSGAFHNDVRGAGGVQLWDARGFKIETLPAILVWYQTESITPGPAGYEGLVTRFLEVTVDAVVEEVEDSDGHTNPDAARIELLLEDVERALTADPEIGDLAKNSEITAVEPFPSQEDSRQIGGHIRLRVHYMTPENDPSTAVTT